MSYSELAVFFQRCYDKAAFEAPYGTYTKEMEAYDTIIEVLLNLIQGVI